MISGKAASIFCLTERKERFLFEEILLKLMAHLLPESACLTYLGP